MVVYSVAFHSTSRAEDASLLALRDASQIAMECDGRIVGGQMVALYRALYPLPEMQSRATIDADTAIPSSIAMAQTATALLREAGYEAERANRYRLGDQIVDILVGDISDKLKPIAFGDLFFDSAPGAFIAVSAKPVVAQVEARLLSGNCITFDTLIPPLDLALGIKALAYMSRQADRDLLDVFHLLLIAEHLVSQGYSEWSLSEACQGSRRDAQRALHKIAMHRDRRRSNQHASSFDTRLVALIRELIQNPELKQ